MLAADRLEAFWTISCLLWIVWLLGLIGFIVAFVAMRRISRLVAPQLVFDVELIEGLEATKFVLKLRLRNLNRLATCINDVSVRRPAPTLHDASDSLDFVNADGSPLEPFWLQAGESRNLLMPVQKRDDMWESAPAGELIISVISDDGRVTNFYDPRLKPVILQLPVAPLDELPEEEGGGDEEE